VLGPDGVELFVAEVHVGGVAVTELDQVAEGAALGEGGAA